MVPRNSVKSAQILYRIQSDTKGIRSMKKKNIGSTFDSWLREEGLYEKVNATAIKRVVARQVEAAMQQKGLTKVAMARRMRTSRSALDRLLDPDNGEIT